MMMPASVTNLSTNDFLFNGYLSSLPCGCLFTRTMKNFILDIAEKCYDIAVKRGKDVTSNGCLRALVQECAEFNQADERGIHARVDIPLFAVEASYMTAEQFFAAYNNRFHNTVDDEVADVLITIATWAYADGMEHTAVINTLFEETRNRYYAYGNDDTIRHMVMLKMRYNELRND